MAWQFMTGQIDVQAVGPKKHLGGGALGGGGWGGGWGVGWGLVGRLGGGGRGGLGVAHRETGKSKHSLGEKQLHPPPVAVL